MDNEQRTAYEWAKRQSYPSVAARYAKLLTDVIDNQESAFKSYISDHTSAQSRINEIFDYYLKKVEEGKLEGKNHA